MGEPRPPVTRRAAAEAAVWVARLHGPDRSAAMEREFQAWLAAADVHRLAFERCTDVWQEVPRLTVADAFGGRQRPAPSAVARAPRRWVLAGLAAVVLAGAWLWPADAVYVTAVGEQRQVVLADGSRLRLNTATKVRVSLGKDQRTLEVLGGEALFEVAKDPARPFVVRVGAHEVRALGTVFSVRLAPASEASDAFAVILLEGQVEVTSVQRPTAPSPPVVLMPGQRLRLAGTESPARLDRPNVDQATAWTRNEVVLDNVSLAEAVAEMNRYSQRPIVLAGPPALADLGVSGVYRAGDNEGFARAVAALHGLAVEHEGDRVVIQGAIAVDR